MIASETDTENPALAIFILVTLLEQKNQVVATLVPRMGG